MLLPAVPKYPALAVQFMITEEPLGLFELSGQDVGTVEPTKQYLLSVQRVMLPPAGPKYPAFAVQLILTEEPIGLFELDGQDVGTMEPTVQ